MSSAAVGTHSGAGPLSLMSCVRESSPLQDFDSDTEKNVASKKKFWNPKKWFKRKNKASGDDVVVVEVTEIGKDALRSRSTSELSVTEEGRRRSSSSMHPGLSVSHDSVFHSPNSGSDMELDAAQSSSSLSISQPLSDLRLQTELTERLRLRRGRGDTSEDDEGLPHSPCNSPTASDGLLIEKTANKDLPTKSHSTCSDGSLLSMGSYEDDESCDPTSIRSYEPHSGHSSKLSLQEKKPIQDSDVDSVLTSTTPLNHSAAHHRVSIKPKRTHGAPNRKRTPQLSTALPVTPEVNEDSSVRSLSPEINKESLIELYSISSTKTLTETQLKCSSLPPGLSAPGADSNRLNRSKSNAGSKSQDIFSKLPDDAREKEERLSLLERIFPRKSGRKKKKEDKDSKTIDGVVESMEKETETSKQETVTDSSRSYTETSTVTTRKIETSKPVPAPRSGAASRQRIVPMDIAETPEEAKNESVILPKPSPERAILESTSPLHAELENRFKQRQISLSTSPSSPSAKPLESPISKSPVELRHPKSLSPNLPTVISSKFDYSHISRSSTTTKYLETKTKSEEIRHSKLKMPGLSSLQQRVLTLNEEAPDKTFMSLTEFQSESKPIRPISKSHSFKAVKQTSGTEVVTDDVKAKTEDFIKKEKEGSKINFNKAVSLDSIKNLDDQIHLSEVEIELKKTPDLIIKTDEQVVGQEHPSEPSITISGPSHTAIVNVTSNVDDFSSVSKNQTSENVDGSTTISIKEQQVSVTKIHVKRETTQVTQSTVSVPKTSVPEFVSKQLNKVEIKPCSNIVFSMKSPKVAEDQNRPKTLFNFDLESDVLSKPPTPRKFSKENLEIIEKEDSTPSPKTSPIVNVSSPRFKKNDGVNSRKSSVISITPESPIKEKPPFKTKSPSLSSLNDSDKSSQDSLDKLEAKIKDKDSPVHETVVLRRKSVATKKNEDEPELMKVFARRSLKIKDSDIDVLQESIQDAKTRDSDKENQSDSPIDERRKISNEPSEVAVEKPKYLEKLKSVEKEVEEPARETSKPKTPTQPTSSPIVLRRTVNNNNVFAGPRAVTVNPMKTSELIIKKQMSFSEHRKTDQWISNMKNEEVELKEKIVQEDMLTNISPSGDFIMEPKNFSQRKAEWEKRAQQARKTTP